MAPPLPSMPAPGPARRTLDACAASWPRGSGASTCWRPCWSGVAAWLGLWQFHAWEDAPGRRGAGPERRWTRSRWPTRWVPTTLPGRLGRSAGGPRRGPGCPRARSTSPGASTTAATATGSVTPLEVDGATRAALLVVRGWTAAREPAPPPPDRARPSSSAGCSRPRGPARPTTDPTDDVLPQLRIADADPARRPGPVRRLRRRRRPSRPGRLAGRRPGDQPARRTRAGSTDEVPTGPAPANHPATPSQWWVFGGFVVFVWWRWVPSRALERAAER